MMVSAPDIDREIVPPVRLLSVVSDIGGEVGIAPITLAEDAILVIPKGGSTQPECAILLIGQSPLREFLEGRGDLALLIDPRLGIVFIEIDTEVAEILILLGSEPRDCPIAEPLATGGAV